MSSPSRPTHPHNASRSRFEALGDRIKMFEGLESERRLMPGLPIIARLDGRSFHAFTRGLELPICLPLREAMIETTRHLVHETKANFGYTQSDEITLGFWLPNPKNQMMFDGRVMKLASVFAGLATAKFNIEVVARPQLPANRFPVFDARVHNVPDLDTAVEAVLFRTLDCAKNSLTMAAAAHYSHSELRGKGSAAKHEMLRAKGVNWADYPGFFKNGTFVRRETVERHLSEAELKRIPAARRPEGPVLRTRVVVVEDMPAFSRLANPKEFLFEAAAPRLRTEVRGDVADLATEFEAGALA